MICPCPRGGGRLEISCSAIQFKLNDGRMRKTFTSKMAYEMLEYLARAFNTAVSFILLSLGSVDRMKRHRLMFTFTFFDATTKALVISIRAFIRISR